MLRSLFIVLLGLFLGSPLAAKAKPASRPASPPPRVQTAVSSEDEMQADLHLVKAKQLLDAGKPLQAAAEMDAILAMEGRVRIPDEFYYHYARCLMSAHRFDEGVQSAKSYLQKAGRGGPFYGKALELIASEEEQKAAWLKELLPRCQKRARELSFNLSRSVWDDILEKSVTRSSRFTIEVSDQGAFTFKAAEKAGLGEFLSECRFEARDLVASRVWYTMADTVTHRENPLALFIFLARPIDTLMYDTRRTRHPVDFYFENCWQGFFKDQPAMLLRVNEFLNTDGLELARAMGGRQDLLRLPDPEARILGLIETMPEPLLLQAKWENRAAYLRFLAMRSVGHPKEQAFAAKCQAALARLPNP